MNKNNLKGFTLIELLVVISIIGLLSTLAVVSLNSARAKARDAKRVSDIKQIQTGLELYFNEQNAYPSRATSALTLGGTGALTLSSTNAFGDTAAGTTYMARVPAAPTPPTGNVYTYGVNSTATGSYCILFSLEAAISSLGTGTYGKATPAGVTTASSAQSCP